MKKVRGSIVDFFFRALGITQLATRACPKCGKPINHIHRNLFERGLSIFIPRLRRYACSDADCDWEGRVIFIND
jgi:hypothetical protein